MSPIQLVAINYSHTQHFLKAAVYSSENEFVPHTWKWFCIIYRSVKINLVPVTAQKQRSNAAAANGSMDRRANGS